MASSRARVEVRAGVDETVAVLRDLKGWSAWMPGIAAIEEIEDGLVEWKIGTPAGEVPVRLRFKESESEGTLTFEGSGGPFSQLSGRVLVSPEGSGSVLELEMSMETEPPAPPAAIVGTLVSGALAALSRRLQQPPSGAPSTPEPERLMVSMSDGVKIAVNRYAASSHPSPAALMFIPYRKEGAVVGELASLITSAGIDFLIADVRGFGGSPAPYEGLLSRREIADGVEMIEWISHQAFCDGSVGTIGASYCGANQILFAARKPPALRCIAPYVGPVDTYRDWTHRGGIPTHILWGAGTYLRSQHPETVRRGLEHYYLDLILDPLDNAAHRERSPETYFSEVEVPALCVGGWHDYFLRGTLRTYRFVGGPKRLVLGPWGHGDFSPRHQQELVRWLAFWLKGEGDDPTAGKRVHLLDTGIDEWRELEDWPKPEERKWMKLNLAEGGSLSTAPGRATNARIVTHMEAVPMASNPKRAFIPDPTDSGMGLWGEDLIFDSESFGAETVVQGAVAAVVSLTTRGCADVDIHARVSMVSEDGSPTQLIEGRLRASHRSLDDGRTVFSPDGDPVVPWHAHDRHEPVPDGRAVELAIEMGALCHTFQSGTKVRLGLTLVRSDEKSEFSSAVIEPESRLFLPIADS